MKELIVLNIEEVAPYIESASISQITGFSRDNFIYSLNWKNKSTRKTINELFHTEVGAKIYFAKHLRSTKVKVIWNRV